MRRSALYARVSSDAQAKESTIESQLDALRRRADGEGCPVLPEDEFIDDGVSGGTLIRPALERLRDRIAEGMYDVLFVLCPDRLARKFSYQALLLEEFKRGAVTVVFLNHTAGDGPEGELLLQVQGVIAEYEKARIIERSRRGKLHKARQGSVSVLSNAPFGYLYVPRTSSQPARLEILAHEAEVVRKIFSWFVFEQVAIWAIAKRLGQLGVTTREGLSYWNSSTVWYILKNPVYKGQAAYGKSKCSEPQLRNRRTRLRPAGPGTRHSTRKVDKEHWIYIDVPGIVPMDWFDAAQEKLKNNRERAPRNMKDGRYLLTGLLICSRCSYALQARTATGGYAYYHCPGRRKTPPFNGICCLPSVRSHALDEAVWASLEQLLKDPQRVTEEYERRLIAEHEDVRVLAARREDILRKVRKQESARKRLIDAYQEGVLSLQEFKPRKAEIDGVLTRLDEETRSLDLSIGQVAELREVVTHLSQFQDRLEKGLEAMTHDQRVGIARLLIKRIEVSDEGATVVYRLPPTTGHG